jgi:SAM-dependent methyltransferase
MHDSDWQREMDESLARMALAENYTAWLLGRARPYLGSLVLDLGAGIGTFAEMLAREVEVVALEPDARLAAVLRERAAGLPRLRVVDGGAALLRGGLEDSFDSILCLNVLEHIEDEAETLAGCFARLVPGGHLLLLVPAHASLFGSVDEVGGHVRRYNAKHLGAVLMQAGFEIVDLRHVNPVGALGWLVFSKLLRRDQVPRAPLASYDRLVPLLRQLDRLRLPFGLSLWAVARRPSTSS